MPKIVDLGITFIPATMRPPEIGQGTGGYGACGITIDPTRPCHPTEPQCVPTNQPASYPTPPQCNATPDDHCCPTENASARDKDQGGDPISPDNRRELMQQLRHQIGAEL